METLINRQLKPEMTARLNAAADADGPILFTIVGDISDKAHYSHVALAVCAQSFFTYSFDTDERSCSYRIADVEEIYNKRMYGNGVMRVRFNGGEIKDVYRFTFAVASLCDAAVYFVKAIKGGTPLEEALGSIEATYE